MIFLPPLPNLSPGHSPLKICFSKQPVRIVLITKGWGQHEEGAVEGLCLRGGRAASGQREECALPVPDLRLPARQEIHASAFVPYISAFLLFPELPYD